MLAGQLLQPEARDGILCRRSRWDVEVAALSDQQKRVERGSDALGRAPKVVEDQDFGVHETPQRPSRDGRRPLERAVETRCPPIASGQSADVLDVRVARGPLHSLLVPDEHDLDVVVKRPPALDRVPLDVADVAAKRLRNGEERQHATLSATPGAARKRAREAHPEGGSPAIVHSSRGRTTPRH